MQVFMLFEQIWGLNTQGRMMNIRNSSGIRREPWALLNVSTCGVLCLLYFQNFPEFRRCASLSSRAVRSLWSSRESSLLTPNRELVTIRTYLLSLSSSVTLLENEGKPVAQRKDPTERIPVVMHGERNTDTQTIVGTTYCGSLSVSAVSFNKTSWSTCNII